VVARESGLTHYRASGYGPLAMTKWYRVVIDEAQNIRNRYGYLSDWRPGANRHICPACVRSTRSSRVMAMLDAEYRWALTGTPVTNTL
jgi:SNF2 family DNA or RNA helicase